MRSIGKLNVRFWNVFEEIQANLRYRKKEERWEGFHKFKSKSSDLRFSNIRNGLCELWNRHQHSYGIAQSEKNAVKVMLGT